MSSPALGIFERGQDEVVQPCFGSLESEWEGVSFDAPASGPFSGTAENIQTGAQNPDQSTPNDESEWLFGNDSSSQAEKTQSFDQVSQESTAENSGNSPDSLFSSPSSLFGNDSSSPIEQAKDLDQTPPEVTAENTSATPSSPVPTSPVQDAGESTVEPEEDEQVDPNVQVPTTEPDSPEGTYTALLNEPSGPMETEPRETPAPHTSSTEDANSQPHDFSEELENIDLDFFSEVSDIADTEAQGNTSMPEHFPEMAPTDDPLPSGHDTEAYRNPVSYPVKPLEDQAKLYADLPWTDETAAGAPEVGFTHTDQDFLEGYGAQESAGSTPVYQGLGLALPAPGEVVQGSAPGWSIDNINMVEGSGAQQTAVPAARNLEFGLQGLNPSPTNTSIDPAILEEFQTQNEQMATQGGTEASQSVSTTIPAGMPSVPGTTLLPANGEAPQTVPAVITGSHRAPIPAPMPVQGPGQMYPPTMPAYLQPPRNPALRDRPSYPHPVLLGEPKPNPPILKHQNKGVRVNPKEIYLPLEATPAPWGPPHHPDLFSYTETGDWNPDLKFSTEDLRHYVQSAQKLGWPLKIWIQHYPAQRNYRHPNTATLKCRWDECPATMNTILKGFYRVAFDERPEWSGSVTDPFHNAGYMHLHCFEKVFDVFELINAGMAAVEKRIFPFEDRNPMSVFEGRPQLLKAYSNWSYVEKCAYDKFWDDVVQGKTKTRDIPRERKLWYVLTNGFVEAQSQARGRMRDARNGNSIDKHLGDLDVFVAANRKSRVLEKKVRKRVKEKVDGAESMSEEEAPSVKRARRSDAPKIRKRVIEVIDDEELTSDEDAPMVKRARRSPTAGPSNPARWGKKRAAEESDEGLTADEDAPRAKRPRRGSPPVRPASPARSHITVASDDEEEGGSVSEMQASAAGPSPSERLPASSRTGKRKAEGVHEAPRRRAWDADLRGGETLFKRPKLTRRASS